MAILSPVRSESYSKPSFQSYPPLNQMIPNQRPYQDNHHIGPGHVVDNSILSTSVKRLLLQSFSWYFYIINAMYIWEWDADTIQMFLTVFI